MVLLSAAVEGSPHAFARIIGEGRLLQVLFQGLKSPLAIEGLSKLFISLRKSVFDAEEESLGQIISTVTLQVVCPAKYQSKAWTKVALNSSLASVLDKVLISYFPELLSWGLSINDVMQFGTIFDPTPPSSRILLLRPYYCCHKILYPLHP